MPRCARSAGCACSVAVAGVMIGPVSLSRPPATGPLRRVFQARKSNHTFALQSSEAYRLGRTACLPQTSPHAVAIAVRFAALLPGPASAPGDVPCPVDSTSAGRTVPFVTVITIAEDRRSRSTPNRFDVNETAPVLEFE